MIDYPESSVAVLLRASVFMAAAFLLFSVLLRLLKVKSTKAHTLGWTIVLLQGVLIIPLHMELPVLRESTAGQPATVLTFEAAERPQLDPMHPQVVATTATAVSRTEASWQSWLAIIWFAGIIVHLAWLLRSWRRFLKRLPSPGTVPERWLTQWNELQQASGSSMRAVFQLTDGVGPAVCWTPGGHRLLIPENEWRDLSHSQRGMILRHELAHMERHDLWKALAFRAIAVVHWFNPFVWLTVGRLAECAEWACDESVSSQKTSESTEYVRTLVRVSALQTSAPSLMPNAAGHSLVRRTRRLLTPNFKEDPVMKRFAILLCLCALALLNGIDFDLVAQERTDDPSAADLPEEQAQERVRTDNEIVVPVDLRLTPPRTLDLVFVDAVSDKPAGSPVSLEPLRGRRATKEAVIDIAYVFQKLPEFARMRKDIQKKAAGHQKVMMVTAEAIRAAQKQLKTSPDAENQGLENELRALMTRMEVSKQLQRDALKKQESQMFLTVFKKIRGAIADHAKENGIHIVRRTSSQRGQLERMEAGDPQAILIAMNEQVLYVADDGIDITDEVLARLLQSDKPQK